MELKPPNGGGGVGVRSNICLYMQLISHIWEIGPHLLISLLNNIDSYVLKNAKPIVHIFSLDKIRERMIYLYHTYRCRWKASSVSATRGLCVSMLKYLPRVTLRGTVFKECCTDFFPILNHSSIASNPNSGVRSVIFSTFHSTISRKVNLVLKPIPDKLRNSNSYSEYELSHLILHSNINVRQK